MKSLEHSRNLWLLGGFSLLISAVLKLENSQFVFLQILQIIICIVFFINAYIDHKKIIKDNKDEDNEQ